LSINLHEDLVVNPFYFSEMTDEIISKQGGESVAVSSEAHIRTVVKDIREIENERVKNMRVGSIWKHYTGTEYVIVSFSQWSGSDTVMQPFTQLVTYRKFGEAPIRYVWSQPTTYFLEKIGGGTLERFTYVREHEL
jgi:hypothetical protein